MWKYEVDQLLALHGERCLEQLVVAYAAGVERSHEAPRARADHEVRADSGVIEHLQHSGVGEAARAAAAEHERDQGAVGLAGQNQRLVARRVLGRGRQARAAGDPQRESEGEGRCVAEERSRAGHRKIVSASAKDGNRSPSAPIHVRRRTDRPKAPDVASSMLVSTPQTRTLNRALERCGGEIALAKALGVTTEALSGWFTGVDVPLNIYFSALDIVAIGSLGSANFKS